MRTILKQSVQEKLDAEIEKAITNGYEIAYFELTDTEYLSLYRELAKSNHALAIILEDYGYKTIQIKTPRTGKPI